MPVRIKLLTLILCTFIFVIPAFGQTDIQDLLDSSRRSEFSKNYQEAINQINKAIDIEPSNPNLYLRRAYFYGHIEDKNAALENVLIAISLKPNDSSFLEESVEALNFSGNYEESLKIAKRLMLSNERGSVDSGYRIRYKTRFQLKDFAGTIRDIIKIGDIFGAYYDGKEQFTNGKGSAFWTDGLLMETLNALKDDPNIFAYYEELFKIIKEKGEGASTTGTMMMLYSMRIDFSAGYAKIYEEKHTPAETAVLFAKYGKDLGLETRATIYKKMGRYELAVKDLADVIKFTRNQSSYLVQRGDLYMLMRQFKEALFDYTAAKRIDKEWTALDEKIDKAKQSLADAAQSK